MDKRTLGAIRTISQPKKVQLQHGAKKQIFGRCEKEGFVQVSWKSFEGEKNNLFEDWEKNQG
jgi:hypothetical protein